MVGECGAPCPAGEIKLSPSDPMVPYPPMIHRQRSYLNCTGQSFGPAVVVCLAGRTNVESIQCSSYCAANPELKTTSHINALVQDDFTEKNYVAVQIRERMNPGSVESIPCGGGSAVVKCENSGLAESKGVFEKLCGVPSYLCGCCALTSTLRLGTSSARKRRGTLWDGEVWLLVGMVVVAAALQELPVVGGRHAAGVRRPWADR